MKHIYLDKYFLFFLLIIILTGNFNYFIVYFSLLFMHEMGHAVTGVIFGYKIKKIVFYPLGGITIFNLPINIPLKKELLILIMGPFMQIIAYLFLKNYFSYIKVYHYTLLIFNLLPIYPLDGGKILNIILNYKFNYLNSINYIFIISLILLFLLFIYDIFNFNLNLFMMIILMFYKLMKFYHNKYYYYNRLLLERTIYDYNFKKIKNIHHINFFYRDKLHFINFMKEKDYLKKHYKI